MKTARHLLAATVVALTLASPAGAEDKTVPESDFTAYKELAQVKLDAAKESLQKDVAALGTRVDNQDKRIDQQGNRIGDVSISLTWFGILLTLLAIIAGFVGYYTASTKARKEAQDEARKAVDDWLKTHEADLKQRIKAAEDFAAESRAHIQTFEDEINQLKAQLSDKLIAHTNNKIAETNALVEDARQQLQVIITQASGQTTPPASHKALEALQVQAENLRHKAEVEYTFEDWNDRALAAFGDSKLEDAIQFWHRASDSPDASPEQVARALANKGIALGRLKRTDEAIATYSLVDTHYANTTAPPLREQVARALFNKGFALRQLGRADEAIAAYDLVDSRYANDTTPALREQVATALINKGFALTQLERTDEAVTIYDLVDSRYANDNALRELVAKALVNKGVALRRLGRTDEAIAAYNLVDTRYACDSAYTLREPVAKARNGKGFTLLCRAKATWADLPLRKTDLDTADKMFEQAEGEHPNTPMILGNRAYCAHLRGDPVEVVRPLLKRALKDGGERLYKGTLDDLAIHPVPEDAAFRVLLDEVWAEVRGEDPPEAAPVPA